MHLTYRDLHSLDDLRQVVDLEREVWQMSDDELVPASLLVASVKCGAVAIGAFDDDRMVGFVYSFPGERHGRRLQWSHMLGVRPAFRSTGVGRDLKFLQRERTLEQGIDLIEWTFDPLQALNAHFNFSKLGAVAREYLEDAYGQTNSPLHRGAPTDRFVAQWWLRTERVSRLAGEAHDVGEGAAGAGAEDTLGHPPWEMLSAREAPASSTSSSAGGPLVNPTHTEGRFLACETPVALPLDRPGFRVAVPDEFTDMLAQAPDLASRWRGTTRRIFQQAFAAGFVVVAFEAEPRGGSYLLRSGAPAPRPAGPRSHE